MNQVIYPSGERETITDELLEKGSDLQRKHVPLTYLRLVVRKPRKFKRTMGVTSALNGMRYNYLKWKMKPDFDLAGSAFMALGIGSHNILDENTADKDTSEEWLKDGLIVGRSDLLEAEGDDLNILTDYKVSGSYKVAMAMGIVEGDPEPLYDDFGNPIVYQRNGKGFSKGDQKMQKTYKIDPEQSDNWEYSMQLNKYRQMYELNGIKISQMRIFFLVRDGGTHMAKSRGVMENIYLLDIPRIPDEEVKEFFENRAVGFARIMKDASCIFGTPEEVVEKTIKAGIEVSICNRRETWDGRRCENYCSYSSACQLFGDNPYL